MARFKRFVLVVLDSAGVGAIHIPGTPTGATVGGSIMQIHSSTGATITYQFSLAAGQTLNTGMNWLFSSQMSGTGMPHPTTGDTYTVTYTTGGVSFTQTGMF